MSSFFHLSLARTKSRLLIAAAVLAASGFAGAAGGQLQPSGALTSTGRMASSLDTEYLVVRVKVESSELAALQQRFDVWAYARDESLKSKVGRPAREAVIQVKREQLRQLRAEGYSVRFDWPTMAKLREMTQSTNEAFRAGEVSQQAAFRSGSDTIAGYPCYRTVAKTNQDLGDLASANPTLATWTAIGNSVEATDSIHALVVTNQASLETKAPILLLATSHAREYAVAEVATRFGELLVNQYGTDPEITALLDTTEVHIIPVHNPDGRALSEAMNPQSWRKNTQPDESCNSSDFGVDLNRNSAQFFQLNQFGGYSPHSCDETYSGPTANSEPETIAVDDYMATVFADQRGAADTDAAPADATGLMISIHSHGELVLMPWEAQHHNPPNHDQLRTLGRKLAHYLPGFDACQDCLGTASGTNVDRAYGRFGVAAYTYELAGGSFFPNCDGGGTTFNDDIWPTTRDSLIYAMKAARRPYQEPQGPEIVDVSFTSEPVPPNSAIPISGSADDTRFSGYSSDPGGLCAGQPATDDCGPEPIHTIAEVYYSIDAPPWTVGGLDSLDPVDGLFNESSEEFDGTISTAGLDGGTHLLYLVAEDSAGNRGVPTVVFLEIDDEHIFSDDFETGNTDSWSSTSG